VFDFAVSVGISYGEVEGVLVDGFGVDSPRFGRIGEGFPELNEFFQVVVVEGIGFAEIAARVELVVPDFAGGCAFIEEENDGFDSGALEDAAGIVENRVEIAAFEKQLAQADGGVVGVGEECIFDDDAAAAAGFENLDEVLEEEKSGFAGFDVEVLLDFLALATAEGRIGQDYLEAVFVLDVVDVFGERVGVQDVGGFDAVEDHVHDPNHVGQGFFFFAEEGAFLEGFEVFGG
jgi:hypothetical protein